MKHKKDIISVNNIYYEFMYIVIDTSFNLGPF